jgi:hypothetical protein
MEKAALSIHDSVPLAYPHSAATMRNAKDGRTANSEILKLLGLLAGNVRDYPQLERRVQADIARVTAPSN